jgi:Fe-S cluster biogenesis protein NfuA
MTTKQYNNLLKRVNETIEPLRPYLQSDGGDITVEEITNDFIVKVKLSGTCESCPFSIQTLKGGIEQALRKKIPEIKEVIAV